MEIWKYQEEKITENCEVFFYLSDSPSILEISVPEPPPSLPFPVQESSPSLSSPVQESSPSLPFPVQESSHRLSSPVQESSPSLSSPVLESLPKNHRAFAADDLKTGNTSFGAKKESGKVSLNRSFMVASRLNLQL